MLYDCRTAADRDRGVEAAIDAVKRGDLVVLPTDTLYGIGADAFKPWAVTALLDAKGRDRQMPPPVLVGTRATLDGLVAKAQVKVNPAYGSWQSSQVVPPPAPSTGK